MHYIDDGRRNPATGGDATGEKFLSGEVAWRDASFDYLEDGDIDVEWCYIKDTSDMGAGRRRGEGRRGCGLS